MELSMADTGPLSHRVTARNAEATTILEFLMPCIDVDRFAMRKLANTWFVKDIKRRTFFQLEGSLAVLWDALLSTANEQDALAAFLDHFQGALEAKRDGQHLVDDLRHHGLVASSHCKPSPSSLGEFPPVLPATDAVTADIQDNMYRLASSLGRPLLAEYETTYRCNLRCVYCYQPTYLKYERRDELGPEEISAMLADFASAGVFFFVITGGECTLTRNFAHTVREARANSMDVMILTNGTALRDDVVEFLASCNVGEVKVSIYGWSPEDYGLFTGSSRAFSRMERGIVRLRDAGVHVVGKVILTSAQESTFRETVQQLRALGIDVEVSAHVMPAMDGDIYPLQYRVSSETLKDLFHEGLLRRGGGRGCTAGTVKFRVSPEGFITSCELERTPMGSIRRRRILDILRDPENRQLINLLETNAVRLAETPATDGLPCPALAKLEDGSWEASSGEAMRWTAAANEAD
jgi:MoaA/NifB/PqqE/SkfB family radical SAM enzyme